MEQSVVIIKSEPCVRHTALLCSKLENQNDHDHQSKSFTFLKLYLRFLCILDVPKALNRQQSQKEKLLKLLIGPFVMNVFSLLALERSVVSRISPRKSKHLGNNISSGKWDGERFVCETFHDRFWLMFESSSVILCDVSKIDEYKAIIQNKFSLLIISKNSYYI